MESSDAFGATIHVQKKLKKKIEDFESPHKWNLLSLVQDFGTAKNNVRMLPCASLDMGWARTYKGRVEVVHMTLKRG